MDLLEFIRRCDAYCARNRIARATLSNKLLQDSRRLQALTEGSDIGVIRLDRAYRDLEALEAAEVAAPAGDPQLASSGSDAA